MLVGGRRLIQEWREEGVGKEIEFGAHTIIICEHGAHLRHISSNWKEEDDHYKEFRNREKDA